MRILLVASHNGQTLSAQMLSVMTALQPLAATVDCVVVGLNCQEIAKQACCLPGVAKVVCVEDPGCENLLAESMVEVLTPLAEGYDKVVWASDTFSKNILPRLAVVLDISPITDVSAIIDEHTFQRPIYAGNAIATVKTSQEQQLLSIRTASFAPSPWLAEPQATIENTSGGSSQKQSYFEEQLASESDKPDLTSAKIVVSGGRGVGSAKDFALVESLADKLGAAVGASRAAVDAGFVPNDYQVGQTGKIIAPDVYIALGISGAVQHLAGMKDSRIIIAIDKDEDAPIFQVADYGLVGDLFTAVPELMDYLNKK